MRGSAPLLLVVVAGSLLVPRAAAAHPAIDEARAHYEYAEFEEALRYLARARRAGELDEAELRELLALRATVHFAMRSARSFRRDLQLLASIAPDHRFDPGLPPAFLKAWELERSLVEPLEIDVEVERDPRRIRLRAHLSGSGIALAGGAPRLRARAPGEPWRESKDGSLTLSVDPEAPVHYWAEVTGPGGVVLTRAGSPQTPRVVRPLPMDRTRQGLDRRTRTAWLVAGGAGAVAVGLAIALVVVARGDGEHSTVVSAPTFSMP